MLEAINDVLVKWNDQTNVRGLTKRGARDFTIGELVKVLQKDVASDCDG